jgi:hypothetical protein
MFSISTRKEYPGSENAIVTIEAGDTCKRPCSVTILTDISNSMNLAFDRDMTRSDAVREVTNKFASFLCPGSTYTTVVFADDAKSTGVDQKQPHLARGVGSNTNIEAGLELAVKLTLEREEKGGNGTSDRNSVFAVFTDGIFNKGNIGTKELVALCKKLPPSTFFWFVGISSDCDFDKLKSISDELPNSDFAIVNSISEIAKHAGRFAVLVSTGMYGSINGIGFDSKTTCICNVVLPRNGMGVYDIDVSKYAEIQLSTNVSTSTIIKASVDESFDFQGLLSAVELRAEATAIFAAGSIDKNANVDNLESRIQALNLEHGSYKPCSLVLSQSSAILQQVKFIKESQARDLNIGGVDYKSLVLDFNATVFPGETDPLDLVRARSSVTRTLSQASSQEANDEGDNFETYLRLAEGTLPRYSLDESSNYYSGLPLPDLSYRREVYR